MLGLLAFFRLRRGCRPRSGPLAIGDRWIHAPLGGDIFFQQPHPAGVVGIEIEIIEIG